MQSGSNSPSQYLTILPSDLIYNQKKPDQYYKDLESESFVETYRRADDELSVTPTVQLNITHPEVMNGYISRISAMDDGLRLSLGISGPPINLITGERNG